MPFQPVPRTAEFRILQEATPEVGGTIEMINTVYLRKTANALWTAGELASAAAMVETGWNNEIRPEQSNAVQTIEVQARALDQEFGPQHVEPVNLPGLVADQTNSLAVAYGVTLLGGPGTAPRRGRLFIPGVPENRASMGALTAAAQSGVRTAMLDFHGTITTGDWDMVIVSRYLAGALRPTAVTNEVADILVNRLLWSQRDRRPGSLGG